MKINKVYLHVGMQKTGTSSIQSTLATNRDLLKKNSYLYPQSWSNWHVKEVGALLYKEKEEERRNILLRKKYTEKDREKIILTLKNEISSSNCENLILSAENIILFSYEGIEKIKSIITKELGVSDIKIIISIRNILYFMNSITQQTIKSLFEVNYVELNKKYTYYNQINKFAEVFGKDNLIVYDFESTVKHTFGVVGCFLEKINFNKESLKFLKIVKTNEGISDIACEIIDFINTKEPLVCNNDISKKRFLGDTKMIEKFSGGKFIIEKKFQKEIIEKSLKDRVWLKENYNIDYLNLKPLKKKKIIFSTNFYDEFISIYPCSSTEIKILLNMYIKDKLSTESIFSLKNKKVLKRILNYIESNEKRDFQLNEIN